MDISNNDIINDWSSAAAQVITGFSDDGDFSRLHLLNPALFSLMDDVKGKKILDAGCGQGYLCRILAKQGAIVTGIEPAEKLTHYAIEREKEEQLGVDYIVQDLSLELPFDSKFDIVVSNMVFMDIPNYEIAVRNCIKTLKKDGMFVFSILHPCFEESVDWTIKQSVDTKEYFEKYHVKQFIGHFFHRTLSEYVNLVIQEGCTITKLVEPQLDKSVALEIKKHERNLHVPSFLIVQAKKL